MSLRGVVTRFPCPHNQQGLHGEHLHDCPGGCGGSGFVRSGIGRAPGAVAWLVALAVLTASAVLVVALILAIHLFVMGLYR